MFARILMLLVLAAAIDAQIEPAKSQLIDEMGRTNSDELEARLDSYTAQLAADQTVYLQILMHRGEADSFGAPFKFLATMKAYLILRKIPENRVITRGSGSSPPAARRRRRRPIFSRRKSAGNERPCDARAGRSILRSANRRVKKKG